MFAVNLAGGFDLFRPSETPRKAVYLAQIALMSFQREENGWLGIIGRWTWFFINETPADVAHK